MRTYSKNIMLLLSLSRWRHSVSGLSVRVCVCVKCEHDILQTACFTTAITLPVEHRLTVRRRRPYDCVVMILAPSTSDVIWFTFLLAYLWTRCVEKHVRLWAGWVYRPQPKRKRTEMTINPLWARYMHQQNATGSQFTPILCRPQIPATNSSIVVSPPVSSLSNAIDRAKLGGKFLIAQNK